MFIDSYDENGLSGSSDTTLAGIRVELLDSNGSTVLYNTTTDASGRFRLLSYKQDAGQRIRITPPIGYKFTAYNVNNAASFAVSGVDSDFLRATTDGVSSMITLPALTPTPLVNISAGLVKLPVITANDVDRLINQSTATNDTVVVGMTGSGVVM